MSDTNKHPGFGVAADDLRRYDWQARLAKLEHKECYSFYEAFSQGAKECHEANDNPGNRVFSCLAVVASFHPNYDARGNPYCSMWSGFNGKRSLNAEDLTETDLAALATIVEEIQDPEYRARVADVLWTTTKNFKAARIAIAAFLESAQRLKTDDLWHPKRARPKPTPVDARGRKYFWRGYAIRFTRNPDRTVWAQSPQRIGSWTPP